MSSLPISIPGTQSRKLHKFLVFVDLENVSQIEKIENYARNQTWADVSIYKFASYLSTQKKNANFLTRSACRDASDFHLALELSKMLFQHEQNNIRVDGCVVLTRDHFGAALVDIFTHQPQWSRMTSRMFHAITQEDVIEFILACKNAKPLSLSC